VTAHRIIPAEHGSGVTVCGVRLCLCQGVRSAQDWRRVSVVDRCHACDLHHERADKAARELGRA